jgi:hypothetical protein
MIDTDDGSAPVRSEDKYRRVCWKLIHHHAYSTRPLLTDPAQIFHRNHDPPYDMVYILRKHICHASALTTLR